MRSRVALALALLLLAPPHAAATHEVGAGAGQLVAGVQQAAGSVADGALAAADAAVQAAARLAGPAGQLVRSAGDTALGAAGLATGTMRDEFVAAGEGRMTYNANGACSGALAQVEAHPPYSSEFAMALNIVAGTGSPALVCANGIRTLFYPHEVQGNPEDGYVVEAHTPDADIWLTISPAGPDGARALRVYYITIFHDVLTFDGTVYDVL